MAQQVTALGAKTDVWVWSLRPRQWKERTVVSCPMTPSPPPHAVAWACMPTSQSINKDTPLFSPLLFSLSLPLYFTILSHYSPFSSTSSPHTSVDPWEVSPNIHSYCLLSHLFLEAMLLSWCSEAVFPKWGSLRGRPGLHEPLSNYNGPIARRSEITSDLFRPSPLTITFSILDKTIYSFWVREQPDYSFIRKWCSLLLQSNWLTGFGIRTCESLTVWLGPPSITEKSSAVKVNGYVEQLILCVIKRTCNCSHKSFPDPFRRRTHVSPDLALSWWHPLQPCAWWKRQPQWLKGVKIPLGEVLKIGFLGLSVGFALLSL